MTNRIYVFKTVEPGYHWTLCSSYGYRTFEVYGPTIKTWADAWDKVRELTDAPLQKEREYDETTL